MVWPHPRDLILYARSSYYYDNMFIICLFLTCFLILKLVLVFNPENCGNVCHNVTFIDATFFSVSGSMLAGNRRKPRFKG